MQNYYTQVSNAIAHYAQQIAYAAADSVAENNNYCLTDNCYKMQFLFNNYNSFTNVAGPSKLLFKQQQRRHCRRRMYA